MMLALEPLLVAEEHRQYVILMISQLRTDEPCQMTTSFDIKLQAFVFWTTNVVCSYCGRPVGQVIIFCSCGFYISPFFFFFSWPILSGHRLDAYHTSTHDVVLVQIQNAGLKCVACGSLEIQDAKIRRLLFIIPICRAISSQLRNVSTVEKNLLNSNISSTCPHSTVNLRPTNSWDPLANLGHPSKFQRVSRLSFVTAPTSLGGGEPNFVQCLVVSWAGRLVKSSVCVMRVCQVVAAAAEEP